MNKKKIIAGLLIASTIFGLGGVASTRIKTDAEDVVTNLSALISKYTNNHVYQKDTIINLNENAQFELSSIFHAESSILERTTYYNNDELWMTNGEGTYSYYGTDSEGNLTNASNVRLGERTDNVAIYGTSMEEHYFTLKDVVPTTDHKWSYDNGVYTSTDEDMIEVFKGFVAPCYLGFNETTQNYLDLTGVQIEEVNGKLVLRLMSSNEDGKLTDGSNGVFSQATISNWLGILEAPAADHNLSDDELEQNNVDIVRGVYGDVSISFTFNNQWQFERDSIKNDWSIPRIYLLKPDTGKYKVDTTDVYGRLLPKPGDHWMESNQSFEHNVDSTYGCWFPTGAHWEHMKDCDVEVSIVRLGELVRMKVIANCHSHDNCHNENNYVYHLDSSNSLNVVLATTHAQITVTGVEVKTPTEQEIIESPITHTPPTDSKPDTTLHRYECDTTINAQKITYTLHQENSCNKDNMWGWWRIWMDSSAGAYIRLTPVQDDAHNSEKMRVVWGLNGGESGETAKGMFLWPKNADGTTNNVPTFDELLNNCDVTIEVSKIGKYVFVKVLYHSNPNYEGVYATRYMSAHISEDTLNLSLTSEQVTLTINSLTVSKF